MANTKWILWRRWRIKHVFGDRRSYHHHVLCVSMREEAALAGVVGNGNGAAAGQRERRSSRALTPGCAGGDDESAIRTSGSPSCCCCCCFFCRLIHHNRRIHRRYRPSERYAQVSLPSARLLARERQPSRPDKAAAAVVDVAAPAASWPSLRKLSRPSLLHHANLPALFCDTLAAAPPKTAKTPSDPSRAHSY